MNREITEKHICEWLTSLGHTKAVDIKLGDVRRLAGVLYSQEHSKETTAFAEMETELSKCNEWEAALTRECNELKNSLAEKEKEIKQYRETLQRIDTESRIAGLAYINALSRIALSDHLCADCEHDFPTCSSGKILFGIDLSASTVGTRDADKVIECEGYALKQPEEKEVTNDKKV